MYKLVILSCVLASVAANFVDPRQAKIIKEQRFNAGDGRAGSAYATENGQVFREETDKSGNRIGQYSYVGDDGKTYTVKYSAGIDGFRILEGAHIRATGADAAPYNPDFANPEPTNPQKSEPTFSQPPPAPRRQPPLQSFVPRQPPPQSFVQQQPIPQRPPPSFVPQQQSQGPPAFVPRQQAQPARPSNPFINPHDSTHRNFQFNQNAGTFSGQNPSTFSAQQPSSVPNCANCAGVNPFRNPFDPSHTGQGPVNAPRPSAGGQLSGHLAGLGAGANSFQETTPSPSFNFPPGELKLNRFDTGFNFNFQS
ncbi:unnamed protein product [Lepeophtheirus salmonis]|uniref:(salmon louse) hypothetical protein n=1 Tax=Lepeophtheirus salmonis TaxID=72036 RepID=A0A7R8CEL7_LEPSM|nr:unnamed protein product [Lepeophtheirus salmonis]CAF2792192.1 unnamed protein product [Lepeophtheirus salmonis]